MPTDTRKAWEMSLGRFLEQAVARDPGKTFIEIGGQSRTYQEFYDGVLKASAMFSGLGIEKGDRVCLFLPNCIEYVYSWFGLSLIGAIAVPVNTAYKRDETAYIFNNAEAKGLVSDSSLVEVAGAAADLAPSITVRLLRDGGESNSPSRSFKDWTDFGEAHTEAVPLASLPEVSPQDISMLVYTSGTTGNPKGVQVTHLMYVAAGQGFAHWTQATPDDRFFTCLPYYHANIQYYSTMGALAAGATLVVADRFSASRFWGQVREAKATIVNFIGMMMPVLAKNTPSPDDKDNTVRLFYGSPSFPPEFLAEFQERFATDIIVGFGMTETCFGTIERIGEDRRAGSSGGPRQHPSEGFENQVRIADQVTGEPVGVDTVGEITINNPAIMPGYWRNDEQNKETLRDGWLFTGDLGWVDADGFLYFVDRKKDIIRRRGENISSQEVENVIKRNPNVLDCAVLAVPSELGEDEVKAYVTPREGAALDPEELVHWCAENLANFKVPRYWEIRDELPRTPSLRVRKDVLRQEREDLVEGCFDREAAGIKLR
ncbi:MAG: AMP-binding protein [Chloroflexi bacterium]|nr:AMP-binding protein [Chloroflexota bacterium]